MLDLTQRKMQKLTLELWQIFKKELLHQDVESIFELETDLFPCLVDMRFLGVRVDVERAHNLKQALTVQEDNLRQQIKIETGIDVQLMAARSVAKVFDKLGLPYERTAKSQAPSFTKNFISNHEHPVVRMIAKLEKLIKLILLL